VTAQPVDIAHLIQVALTPIFLFRHRRDAQRADEPAWRASSIELGSWKIGLLHRVMFRTAATSMTQLEILARRRAGSMPQSSSSSFRRVHRVGRGDVVRERVSALELSAVIGRHVHHVHVTLRGTADLPDRSAHRRRPPCASASSKPPATEIERLRRAAARIRA